MCTTDNVICQVQGTGISATKYMNSYEKLSGPNGHPDLELSVNFGFQGEEERLRGV